MFEGAAVDHDAGAAGGELLDGDLDARGFGLLVRVRRHGAVLSFQGFLLADPSASSVLLDRFGKEVKRGATVVT